MEKEFVFLIANLGFYGDFLSFFFFFKRYFSNCLMLILAVDLVVLIGLWLDDFFFFFELLDVDIGYGSVDFGQTCGLIILLGIYPIYHVIALI